MEEAGGEASGVYVLRRRDTGQVTMRSHEGMICPEFFSRFSAAEAARDAPKRREANPCDERYEVERLRPWQFPQAGYFMDGRWIGPLCE